MSFTYIHRSLEPALIRAAKNFPAIVLTGPRQSGKTTVLKHLFGESHRYVSMDDPDARAFAAEDPRGFLSEYKPPVIIDEIQYVPDLMHYIKIQIDENRSERGMFLITGSQNLILSEKVTETLAGRTAVLQLLPMSHSEVIHNPSRLLPWEADDDHNDLEEAHLDMWSEFLRGYYPELVAQPQLDRDMWHAAYSRTYIEREVRNLRQIGDLNQFQSFILALAVRCGQLLNLTDLARDIGVAVNTVKHWISVLEATYQIIILRPYFENMGKRVVKTPKVFFTDTGTLCYLARLKEPGHAADGPMGGPIFENAVVTEIYKRLTHRGDIPQMFFWRTSSGVEVDVLIQSGAMLVPVEVKKIGTPKSKMAASIKTLFEDFGERMPRGFIVYTGNTKSPVARNITAVPFNQL